MTTERTKVVKTIENDMIKYARVPIGIDDIIAEKDLEIKRLQELIDTLREQITQLEQEKQRYELRDVPMDSADSYQIYK
jgi:polyhydroxyalkanoate synthesis regulator phasin